MLLKIVVIPAGRHVVLRNKGDVPVALFPRLPHRHLPQAVLLPLNRGIIAKGQQSVLPLLAKEGCKGVRLRLCARRGKIGVFVYIILRHGAQQLGRYVKIAHEQPFKNVGRNEILLHAALLPEQVGRQIPALPHIGVREKVAEIFRRQLFDVAPRLLCRPACRKKH